MMEQTYTQPVAEKNSESCLRGKYERIGLLDHMGFGNMGDAAVHESFVQNIKGRLPHASLIAFSLNPDDTKGRHNIPAYPITWNYPRRNDPATLETIAPTPVFSLASIAKRCRIPRGFARRVRNYFRELAHLRRSYAVVRSLDLLIIAGGGQLTDLWRVLPYNIFKFCLLARLARTPVFIVGVGADLIRGRSSKFFAGWSVRLANYASFRDAESQALIRSLGVRKPTRVCPDPVYALDVRQLTTPKPSGALTRKVGLNPMGFCDPRLWPRKDEAAYRCYLDKLTQFSLGLLARNYTIELFTSDIGVDRYAIDDLRARLLDAAPREASERLVSRPVLELHDLLLQIRTFDFVITPKFHGVVFSHLLGKPVIALSYLPKIDRLMRAVGHDFYCLDIERFDVHSLIEKFDSLVRDSADLTRRFRKMAAMYRERLDLEFDNLFSQEAAPAEWQDESGWRKRA
jgi:polysaccharide pyruvyl transferase WcaK-like protein